MCDQANCTHMDDMWTWKPAGPSRMVPAYLVYCNGCERLIFSVLYDAEVRQHRVSFPDYIDDDFRRDRLEMLRKKFETDDVVEVPRRSDGVSNIVLDPFAPFEHSLDTWTSNAFNLPYTCPECNAGLALSVTNIAIHEETDHFYSLRLRVSCLQCEWRAVVEEEVLVPKLSSNANARTTIQLHLVQVLEDQCG